MKKITLIALMLFTALGYAQVGINTNNPDASSALEIESTTGGILIPRLTETQRDDISAPATGLMIYQTNGTSGFYFWDGNVWTKIDGVAGPQGTDGTDGADGTDGVDGTNGSDGVDGAQGAQGVSGPQGETGVAGPAGDQGVAGPQGATGPSGANGVNGTTGSIGPAGTQGVAGPQGTTGPSGANGINGINGIDGQDGTNGNDGQDGNDGAPGTQGSQGVAGPQGETGVAGPAGANGTNGADGNDGANGSVGAPGPQGIQGLQGDIGLTGANGSAGAPGPEGQTGLQGIQGLQGDIGLTGATGPPGANGADGNDGAPGLAGADGNDGQDGSTGPSGTPGANGTNGADGNDGANGSAGVQGPQGEAGLQGIQGTQGDIGLTGATGPQGQTGDSSSGNSVIKTTTSDLYNLEGLNDGDLVFNFTNRKLYVYNDPSLTIDDNLYLLYNSSTTSTGGTINVSYIISFQVEKRVKITTLPLSSGGNYASATPTLYEDNNDINDGIGNRIFRSLSYNQTANMNLVPNKTYRILYIGYGNNNYIETSNINNYDYDTSIITNLQTHKSNDIFLYYSIPENYNIEETSIIPNFSEGTVGLNKVETFQLIVN